MISEEAVKKIIEQQVAAKLMGDKSVASQPPEPPAPKPEPKPEPIVKQLDEIDSVRLENLLLRQEAERLEKKVEEMRVKHAEEVLKNSQMELQKFLIDKYEVDTAKNQLVINPSTRTLTITPRELPPSE